MPLNLALMRHPFNWIIITLMVILGSMFCQYIFASAKTDAE